MSLVHDARTMRSVGRQLSRSIKKFVLFSENEFKHHKISTGVTASILEVVLGTFQRLCDENSLLIKVGCMQLHNPIHNRRTL